MAFDRAKFKDLFVTEAEEQITQLSASLLEIEKEPGKSEHYESLMRHAHTVKGAAATMGYTGIAQLSHALEDVFHAAERGAFLIDSRAITTLLSGVDLLSDALKAVKESDTELDTASMSTSLRELLSGSEKATQQEEVPSAPAIPEKRSAIISTPSMVKVGTEKLDTLMGIFEELLMLRLKLDTMLEPALEIVRTNTDPILKQKLFFISEFRVLFSEMSRLLGENQEGLLAIRLVTLDQIFGQYPRMIRDLAVRQNKKIDFVVEGGDIALDRTVIDGLGGALAHLLRNAVDHGIRTEGKITLSAKREKGRAIVVVEDNGDGIDYARVREVAVTRKVETQERIDTFSDQDVAELLFHPNMSTNETVTDISGRGVGVSAVYAFARDVGGHIEVISPVPGSGRGTRFTLDLPVSLATIRVLIVESKGYTFAIPFESIDRTHEFTEAEVTSVAHQEALVLDGSSVPLIHLEEVLRLAYGGRTPHANEKRRVAVIVNTERSRVAIEVDACAGEQDLLIKSLPPILRDIKGFSGSALLPDGRTILLLDIRGLLTHAVGDILEHAIH